MFEWLGNAWDDFTGYFGGSDDGYNPGMETGNGGYDTSILSDLDIDGSGSIGDKPISSYNPENTYDFGTMNVDGYNGYNVDGVSDVARPNNPANPNEKPWYSALLSPSVLGAMVTSGAGLLGGLGQMDMQKQQLAAAAEQRKMNQLLELAKLKYQLLGKGASGSSGRRGGGAGGGADPRQAINAQASAALASGYQNLGGNLASIYR